MKCGCISEHKDLHVNLSWDTNIGVKPRKLWNVIRILLLEGATQLTCISSKDNLLERPGSVNYWTKINLYLLHWFLDKSIAVLKQWLQEGFPSTEFHTTINYQLEWRDITSTLLPKRSSSMRSLQISGILRHHALSSAAHKAPQVLRLWFF